METDKRGRRIRAFRKLKGLTQVELAQSLGISLSVLGEIERGNRRPTDRLIEGVADTLDIPIEEFVLTDKE